MDGVEEFREAVRKGDAAGAKRALESSAAARGAIDAPFGAFGARAINIAANDRPMLDVLLDFGADVNLRSDWANGPFGVLDSCSEEIARHLLTRGAILTAHAAARLGWLDELRRIVDANPNVVHEKGGDGQRPLHFAKTAAIADFLLERGAEMDAQCVDHHSTPAQYALVERSDVCRRLLERGATPDIFMAARLGDSKLAEALIARDPKCVEARVNWPGYALVPAFNIYCWTLGFFVSPHEVARNAGHRDVVELLLRHSSPVVRLLDAAWRGDANAAEDVIDESPNVMKELTTPQHALFACGVHHQRDAAVKLMLDLGFDPAAGGIEGGSALHQAGWVGRPDYIELLLSRHSSLLTSRDPNHGGTPADWAKVGSTQRCNEKGNYPRAIEMLKTET